MEEIMTSIKQLSDGGIPQISEQQLLIVLAVTAVIGLIICFFGVKIYRLFAVVSGIVFGAVVGVVVVLAAEVSGAAVAGVILACSIVLAVLFGIFYRIGLFFWALVISISIGETFVLPDSIVMLLICLGIGLVLAIITAIFWKPMVIILSAVWGGITAGAAIVRMTPFEDNPWIMMAVCAVLVLLGLVIQFMMKSREVSKKERVYSEKFKKNASMETEVEKARHLLEDDEEMEEDSSDEDTDDDIKILEE